MFNKFTYKLKRTYKKIKDFKDLFDVIAFGLRNKLL